jgi:hypothetical protein
MTVAAAVRWVMSLKASWRPPAMLTVPRGLSPSGSAQLVMGAC